MISYSEALQIVRQLQPEAISKCLPLRDSCGFHLAEPIRATLDSPAFDNSAMDGYAVGSIGEGPWSVVGEIAAGSGQRKEITDHEAVRIFTGAPTPIGAVGVIPQEDAALEGNTLSTTRPVEHQDHIRIQGEEFVSGTPLFSTGTSITPPVVAALASLGLDSVRVIAKARIAIVSTGDEIVLPGQELAFGQVYNSNSVALATTLKQLGYLVDEWHVADNLDAIARVMDKALAKADIVLTTGGVSVGAHDHIPSFMKGIGFELQFRGLKIKPGRPTTFATRTDGRAWFGLPGNPQSTWTAFILFVLPYLDEDLTSMTGTVITTVERKSGREEFMPARFHFGERLEIELVPIVGSHSVMGLAVVDGIVRIPAEDAVIEAGRQLECLQFPWRRRP